MKNPFSGRTAKDIWFGHYDYKFLCMPTLNPYSKKKERVPPPFFAKDQWLGIFLAAVMGLQHAMAMIGGIITPPLLLYNSTFAAYGGPRDVDTAAYLVNAALICSGLTTLLQVISIRFGKSRYQIGTGLISVMGTSFTWLPIAQEAINLQAPNPKIGLEGVSDSWNEAYGKVLGTFAVCAFVEIMIAITPPRFIRRVCPPMISGVAVSLIGIGLIGSGFKNWGGGAFCADNFKGILPPKSLGSQCFVSNATVEGGYSSVGPCFASPFIPKCTPGNGDVALTFGSGAYLGMGLATASFMVIIELFGSPFLRNCNVILGLLFGCFVSAIGTVDGNNFWNTTLMDNAPAFTFLWTETFPLAVYGPLVIPACIAYVITAVETIGDIAATEEASEIIPEGPDHERRVSGGVLGDAVNSIFACLAMSTPNTTFSQNNGVIALTRCASIQAGIACGLWLIIAGVVAKIGAFFVSIPFCVLGGMTTFLFANVFVSGIRIITMNQITRRNRFILAMAFSFGVGVSIVPQWASSDIGLWPLTADMSPTVRGLRSTVVILLSTGYAVGTLVAMFLHMIMPYDDDDRDMMRSVKLGDALYIENSRKGVPPSPVDLFDDAPKRQSEGTAA